MVCATSHDSRVPLGHWLGLPPGHRASPPTLIRGPDPEQSPMELRWDGVPGKPRALSSRIGAISE